MIIGLKVNTEEELFENLAQQLHDAGYLDSVDEFPKALYERETQGLASMDTPHNNLKR